jgi:hypothetical protein
MKHIWTKDQQIGYTIVMVFVLLKVRKHFFHEIRDFMGTFELHSNFNSEKKLMLLHSAE